MSNGINFDGFKLLYVEDEPLIAITTAELLEEFGFIDISSKYSLRAADQACHDHEFDLAILDINLGGKEDSLDLGARLSAAGCVVLYISGYNSDRTELEKSGYNFLVKPITRLDLNKCLETIFQNHFSSRVQ